MRRAIIGLPSARDMALRQQIAAGFAVLLVPLAIVALVALSTISDLGGAVGTVLADNDRSLEAVAQMDVALERLDSAALLWLLDRDAEAGQVAGPAQARFRDALATAAGNLTIEGEGEIVDEIERAFDETERSTITISTAGPDAARAAYASGFAPAFERVRGGLERLSEANREAAAVAARDAQATARSAFWGVLGGVVLALALGVWAAARLSRQIAAGAAAGGASGAAG